MAGERNQKYYIQGEGEADEQKSQLLDAYRDGFMSGRKNRPESLEKTVEEEKLISWTMEETGKFAVAFGVKPYRLQPEHFHIISDLAMEEYRQGGRSGALMTASAEGIISGEKEFRGQNKLDAAILLAHECLHLHSLTKVKFARESGREKLLDRYRSGVAFWHGEEKSGMIRRKRFSGLNEAITQDLTKFFYARVMRQSDEFKADIELVRQVAGAEDWEFPRVIMDSYPWLVRLFNDICDKIMQAEPERFKHINDVKFLFFLAYFNGEIKDMKPLLDIIGSGSFDRLSDISHDLSVAEIIKVAGFRKDFGLTEDTHLVNLINGINIRL